jgi:hypothetical protein
VETFYFSLFVAWFPCSCDTTVRPVFGNLCRNLTVRMLPPISAFFVTRSLHDHTGHDGLTTSNGVLLLEVSSDLGVTMNSIGNLNDIRESLLDVISLLAQALGVVVVTKGFDHAFKNDVSVGQIISYAEASLTVFNDSFFKVAEPLVDAGGVGI